MCDVCVCCWYECAYVMCDMFAVHTACYHCVSSVAVADGKHEEQEKPVVMPGEVVQFEVGMEELESLGTLNAKVSVAGILAHLWLLLDPFFVLFLPLS